MHFFPEGQEPEGTYLVPILNIKTNFKLKFQKIKSNFEGTDNISARMGDLILLPLAISLIFSNKNTSGNFLEFYVIRLLFVCLMQYYNQEN